MTNYNLLDYNTLEDKWKRTFKTFNDAFMFMELYSIKGYITTLENEIVWDPNWDSDEILILH